MTDTELAPDVPLEAYHRRAATRRKPTGYVERHSPVLHLSNAHYHEWADELEALAVQHATEGLASSTLTGARSVWADISKFQRLVTRAYPYDLLACRLDSGYGIDSHAAGNRKAVDAKGSTIDLMLGYVVFIPGQTKAIEKRLVNAFGKTHPGFAAMTDMESGKGFAGPGNHSNEANDFDAWLAEWTGSARSVVGYANAGDWASNWPKRPSSLKRIVANYSSHLVAGVWGQQYHGGTNYPVPKGLPTSVAPFGSYVDLNTAALTPAALVASLLPVPPKPKPVPAPPAAFPAWPWPASNTADVLGNAANPSAHVHGGAPVDNAKVKAAVWAVKRKMHALGFGGMDMADHTWGDGLDAALVAYRKKFKWNPQGAKTIGSAGYHDIANRKA